MHNVHSRNQETDCFHQFKPDDTLTKQKHHKRKWVLAGLGTTRKEKCKSNSTTNTYNINDNHATGIQVHKTQTIRINKFQNTNI